MKQTVIGVLGATGRVGHKVCECLAEKPYHKLKGGYRNTIPDRSSKKIEWIFVDVFQRQSLLHFCKGCSVIVNCISGQKEVCMEIAEVSQQMGIPYIDTYGTEKLKQEIALRKWNMTGTYVLGCGAYPGLTGIVMKYLISKYPHVNGWLGMTGSIEPISAGAAKDLLYSSIEGFGMDHVCIKQGVLQSTGENIRKIYLSELQEEKYIRMFLPNEIASLAKANAVKELAWYNIIPDMDSMDLMRKCYQKLLQGCEVEEEIQNFINVSNRIKERWNILRMESKGGEKVSVSISNSSAYDLTGMVAAFVVDEVAKKEAIGTGIFSAHDIIDGADIFKKLQKAGICITETEEKDGIPV